MLLQMKQTNIIYNDDLDRLDDRRAHTISDFYGGELVFTIDGFPPNYFYLDGKASDLFNEKKALLRAFYDNDNPIYNNGVIKQGDEWKYKNQTFSTEDELENRLLEIQDELIKLGVFSNAWPGYLDAGAYINIAPNRIKFHEWASKEAKKRFWDDLEEVGGALIDWFDRFDDNNYDLPSWCD